MKAVTVTGTQLCVSFRYDEYSSNSVEERKQLEVLAYRVGWFSVYGQSERLKASKYISSVYSFTI